ncbi:hypothetical protein Hanom_Chr08g00731331 [Helianthus anomalus]
MVVIMGSGGNHVVVVISRDKERDRWRDGVMMMADVVLFQIRQWWGWLVECGVVVGRRFFLSVYIHIVYIYI